ncbi:MAG: hypothetical protein ABIO05_02885 [Ferruginibacter sp.]
MKKYKALDTVNELLNDFELEDLIEKLIFTERVEKGIKQVKEGKTISHEQVRDISKKW